MVSHGVCNIPIIVIVVELSNLCSAARTVLVVTFERFGTYDRCKMVEITRRVYRQFEGFEGLSEMYVVL